MRYTGELKIITGSALFAFIPVCVLLGKDLSIYALIFGRLFVAAFVLFLFQKNKNKSFQLSFKDFVRLLSWSLLMLGAMICYFLSIHYSSIAVSSALLGTQPLVIILIAAYFLKEKISKSNMIASVVVLIGIVCITGMGSVGNPKYFVGEFLAILSAILLALNFIFQKNYLKEFDGYKLVFYQCLFQLPFLFPFLFYHSGTPSINAIIAILLLGILCTVISYTLIYNGIKKVPTQKIGVLQSVEYVIPILIGILFYHEQPSFIALCGMALIILVCFAVGLKQKNTI